MATAGWRADPLTWGRGAHRFEVFLEPTCPFSARAFGKLWAFLDHVGEDRATLHIRLISQPWHLFSGIVTRAILGRFHHRGGQGGGAGGDGAVYDHREEFEFEDHCAGANLDATPNQIIARMEGYSGVAAGGGVRDPRGRPRDQVALQVRPAERIHVSPTFMIDGLVAPALGSGDSIEEWARHL